MKKIYLILTIVIILLSYTVSAIVSHTASQITGGNLDSSRLPSGGNWALTSNLSITGGNVGIGITSPEEKMVISGDSSALKIQTAGAPSLYYASLRIIYDSGNPVRFTGPYGQVLWGQYGANNGNLVLVPTVGNVGIGTTTPSAKLDVSGSAGQYLASFGDPTYGGRLMVYHNGSSPWADQLLFGDGSGWKFNIGKRSDNGTTSFVTMQDNGNVGIGTANPNYKFQIRTGTDQNFVVLGPVSLGSGNSIGSVNDANTVLTPLEFRASVYDFSVGNVGIGTATPTQKLDVAGNVNITGGYYSSTAWTLIPFAGTWTYSDMRCRRIGSFLQIKGYVSGPSTVYWGSSGLTLPAACRPSADIYYASALSCWSGGYDVNPGFIYISTGGDIQMFYNAAKTTCGIVGTFPAD
jgi:hypothetical protein